MTGVFKTWDQIMTPVRTGTYSLLSNTSIRVGEVRHNNHYVLIDKPTGKILCPSHRPLWANCFLDDNLTVPLIVRGEYLGKKIYYLIIPNFNPDGSWVNAQVIGVDEQFFEVFERPPQFAGEVLHFKPV